MADTVQSLGFESESAYGQGINRGNVLNDPRHSQDEPCPSIYELRRDLSIVIGDEVERLEEALQNQVERIDDLGAAGKSNGKTLDKLCTQAEVQAEEQRSLSFRLESLEEVVSGQASGLVKLAASFSQSQETCRDSVDSLALRTENARKAQGERGLRLKREVHLESQQLRESLVQVTLSARLDALEGQLEGAANWSTLEDSVMTVIFANSRDISSALRGSPLPSNTSLPSTPLSSTKVNLEREISSTKNPHISVPKKPEPAVEDESSSMSIQTAIAYSFDEDKSSTDEDKVDDDGIDLRVFRDPQRSRHRRLSKPRQATESPRLSVQASTSLTSATPTAEVLPDPAPRNAERGVPNTKQLSPKVLTIARTVYPRLQEGSEEGGMWYDLDRVGSRRIKDRLSILCIVLTVQLVENHDGDRGVPNIRRMQRSTKIRKQGSTFTGVRAFNAQGDV